MNHRAATCLLTAGRGYSDIETIVQSTEENFTQTIKDVKVSFSQETYDSRRFYTASFVDSQIRLLKQRMEEERIRDCDGDLHSAHIYFGNEVHIFD
jgi:aminoglycoside phosphotransferase family enzyme